MDTPNPETNAPTAAANPAPAPETTTAAAQTAPEAKPQPSDEYKALQRLESKLHKLADRIDNDTRFDELRTMVNEMRSKVDGNYALGMDLAAGQTDELGNPKTLQHYNTYRQMDEKRKADEDARYLNSLLAQQKKALKDEGFDENDADIKDLLTGQYTPEVAAKLTIAMARKARAAREAASEEAIAKRIKEAVNAELVKRGLHRVDMGHGSETSPNLDALLKKDLDSMSYAELLEYQTAISKAAKPRSR